MCVACHFLFCFSKTTSHVSINNSWLSINKLHCISLHIPIANISQYIKSSGVSLAYAWNIFYTLEISHKLSWTRSRLDASLTFFKGFSLCSFTLPKSRNTPSPGPRRSHVLISSLESINYTLCLFCKRSFRNPRSSISSIYPLPF